MATSAYQQSVSAHRRSGTGSDQLSKSTLAGDPRHRNNVTQPEPAGTDAGGPAAAQNASVPGSPGSPYAAKVFSMSPLPRPGGLRIALPKCERPPAPCHAGEAER